MNAISDAISEMLDEMRTTKAEVGRLREALAFYADPENWKRSPVRGASPTLALLDAGEKARKALRRG